MKTIIKTKLVIKIVTLKVMMNGDGSDDDSCVGDEAKGVGRDDEEVDLDDEDDVSRWWKCSL